jgi:hypothetical protein
MQKLSFSRQKCHEELKKKNKECDSLDIERSMLGLGSKLTLEHVPKKSSLAVHNLRAIRSVSSRCDTGDGRNKYIQKD